MADDAANLPKRSRIKAAVAKIKERQNDTSAAPPWVDYVAMLTGILAGAAGFLTVRSTTLTNNAIFEANQAILEQAQSSDAWAEYQAESIKARIIETQLAANSGLDPQAKASLEAADKDFRDAQPKIAKEAQSHESERNNHLESGKDLLATRDLISYADLAVQLGIALASVAAMVRVRRAFDAALLVGATGIGIAAYALIRQYIAGP